jgi:hypothetical protein
LKLLSKIAIILPLLVCCVRNTPKGQIDQMLKRVDVVEHQVEVLYNQDFDYLVREYQALDTTVARTKDISNEMELLQAYLQQFEDQRLVILDNVELSRKQLSDLQDDVKKHLYDDETTSKYIQDEEKELHMMEAQVKYFQEKFDAQKEVVKQLRKE